MSEIKSVEEAAENYRKGMQHQFMSIPAFKAGAEWQKEQDKEIREALKKIIEWHDIHNAISFIDEEIITNAKRLL